MKLETLLITGGSGYLGRHLSAKAVEKYNVYAAYSNQPDQIKAGQAVALNLIDRAEVLALIKKIAPKAIIHTAAINPGQGNPQQMMKVNGDGAGYVAEAAAAVGARLVHVSTDMVFDGKNAPYNDDAPPLPVNDYGRSKAAGEARVMKAYPQAAIARTSLIYGLEEMDRGTAGFVERLNRGETLTLFTDVIRQPVWVDSLAAALLKLVEIDFAGALNVAGSQPVTRQEFGRRMLAYWQVDAWERVASGRAAEISAAIPLDLRLSVERAEQLLQIPLPGVDEVLEKASN